MRLWILILLLMVSSPLFAAVYKWTDENGKVHYGDQPGRKNAQSVNVPKPSPSISPAQTDEPAENSIELQLERMRRMELEEELKRAQERGDRVESLLDQQRAKDNAEDCRRAKVQVDYYKDARRRGCRPGACEQYDDMRRQYEKQAKLYCN